MEPTEIVQTVLALGGSSTAVIIALKLCAPAISKALESFAKARLLDAQRKLVTAQARVTSEAITQQQLDAFRTELLAQNAALRTELAAAKSLIAGLRSDLDEARRLLGLPTRPTLHVVGDEAPSQIAALETVRRARGDER